MLREVEGHKTRGCKVHRSVEVHDAKGCTVRLGDVRLCSILGASVLGDHGPVTKESGRPPGRFLADNRLATGSCCQLASLDEYLRDTGGDTEG
jgi:hypothetical protein